MTTNLEAIAGPSKITPSPKVEPASPDSDSPMKELTPGAGGSTARVVSGGGVSKGGLTVDEKGEVNKVPAFLNKLFSMVSDPSTNELIFWSDSGDSFFVPNTERFGKELLPRFFKHSNFSSFVRQLNMYGFHKVPQPQTGVLKSDNPDGSELWEFTNPHFKRDQQHLLSRVTRKNNRPTNLGSTGSRGVAGFGAGTVGGVMTPGGQFHPHPVHLITDGSTEGEIGSGSGSGMLVGPSSQQMLDLSAINSGIAAIRQTQATIGADLKALQTSNEHLWREAIEAREIHQKHEETINLIITFLERLFGTEGEGLKGLKEVLSRGRMHRSGPGQDGYDSEPGSAKKRRRVGLDRMISDGRAGLSEENELDENGQIVELPSESQTPATSYSGSGPRVTRKRSRGTLKSEPTSAATTDPWSSTSQRFQALPDESPQMTGTSSRTGTPNASNTNNDQNGQNVRQNQNYPVNPNAPVFSPNDPNALVPYNTSSMGMNNEQLAQSLNLDPALLQTTIGSLLQSPAAAEMFLNSLNNSVQGQALQSQSNPQQTPTRSQNPFSPNFDMTGANAGVSGGAGGGAGGVQGNVNANDPTLALFSPLPNQAALMENQDALTRSYQQAAKMGGDVENLQESINSLVRSMGLDLNDGNSQLDGQIDPQLSGKTQTQLNGKSDLPNTLPSAGVPGMAGMGVGVGVGAGGATKPGSGSGPGGLTNGVTGIGGAVPGSGLGTGSGTTATGTDTSSFDTSNFDDFDVDQFLNSLTKAQEEENAAAAAAGGVSGGGGGPGN